MSTTYKALGYCGGGKLYEGTDLDAAIAAARSWATEQDAGAAVYDTATGEHMYAQHGTTVLDLPSEAAR